MYKKALLSTDPITAFPGYVDNGGIFIRKKYLFAIISHYSMTLWYNGRNMENIHINSLNIETYRGIKNLCLEGFSGINIITGDNNCGKTSVMELLHTVAEPTQIQFWLPHIRRISSPSKNITYYEGLIDLFDKEETDSPKIKYSIVDSSKKEHVITVTYKIRPEAVSTRIANRLSLMKFSTEEKQIVANRLDLSFDYNSQENKDYKIYEFQDYLGVLPIEENVPVICKPVVYVSPTAHGNNFLYLKEILNDSELYPEMLSILQDFDPDIISINQYVSRVSSNYYCGILTKKFKNALPLNMYGDGMKKAILLMSAVVAAKGGILLIDEFETAIHTSAMTKIYAWILKTCKKLNIQLFLTTHSKEALQKVLALNSESDLKDDITLFTLYKREEKTIVRKLSAERAIEADENFNQELR